MGVDRETRPRQIEQIGEPPRRGVPTGSGRHVEVDGGRVGHDPGLIVVAPQSDEDPGVGTGEVPIG